jgi:hypothetical protein
MDGVFIGKSNTTITNTYGSKIFCKFFTPFFRRLQQIPVTKFQRDRHFAELAQSVLGETEKVCVPRSACL